MSYKANDKYVPTAISLPYNLLDYSNTIVRILERCNVEYTLTNVVEYTAKPINDLYKDILGALVSEGAGLNDFADETTEQIIQDVKRIFREETNGTDTTPKSFTSGFKSCLYIDDDNVVRVSIATLLSTIDVRLSAEQATMLNQIDNIKTTLESSNVIDSYVNVEQRYRGGFEVRIMHDNISRDIATPHLDSFVFVG